MKDTRTLVWIAVAALAAGVVIGFAVGRQQTTPAARSQAALDELHGQAVNVLSAPTYTVTLVHESRAGGLFANKKPGMTVHYTAPGVAGGWVTVDVGEDWAERAGKEIRKQIADQRAVIAKAEQLRAEAQGKAKP